MSKSLDTQSIRSYSTRNYFLPIFKFWKRSQYYVARKCYEIERTKKQACNSTCQCLI